MTALGAEEWSLPNLDSGADLSNLEGYAVQISAGTYILATSGANAAGVLTQGGAASGDLCGARMGPSRAIAGAAITAGDDVTVNASGKFITSAATNVPVGVALSDATGDLSWFKVFFRGQADEVT